MDDQIRELVKQSPEEVMQSVCVLCESGYHDHEVSITHLMQCGCPCHVKRDSATAGK